MSPQIPEGTPVGEIEASLAWLLSHTPRFLGIIFVRVNTGGGFILIEYGRPVGFFFRMGDKVLQGAAAWEFFERQQFLYASLCRYTGEEFQEALKAAGPEALVLDAREEIPGPRQVSAPFPAQISGGERTPETVLDHIYGSPGVTSAVFFRKGSILYSRGESSPGHLIEPAEGILLSAMEVHAMLSTGPLVQVTLRFFGRNITIAPFQNGYLMFLTEPEVNTGQIRKLVHDAAWAGTA
jgi:hypothetical protein